MDGDERDLLTVREAAAAIHVSTFTIYRKVSSGELPARRVGQRGRLRIERAALEQLLRPVGPRGDAA